MIGWTQIKPVLIEVFTEISRDTNQPANGFTAEWEGSPAGFIKPEQSFVPRLKVLTVSGVGEDETRREVVGGKLYETQVGQRLFTLQVQIVCPSHTDDAWAMSATERIRTRIRRPRILDRLLDVGVSVRRIGNAVKMPPFKDNGRAVNMANLDVFLGTVVNDADPIPVGVIDYVVASGHLRDSNGTELPSPPNWTNNEIPEIPDL